MRILAALLLALPIAAQQPMFEVATLKLSPPPTEDRININLGTWRNGRLTMDNVTLGDMIKFAYERVSDDQLVPPAWNRDVRFDVEGLAPVRTSETDLHLMVQALLADRLHLVLRHEKRVLPYLALTVANSGPKMKPSQNTEAQSAAPQVRGRISHPAMTMFTFTTLLSRFERQIIVDQTELKGNYDIKLEWSPETFQAESDTSLAPTPERPSLFTAVREQLGLKLESRRGPLDVLVVEGALRTPEAN